MDCTACLAQAEWRARNICRAHDGKTILVGLSVSLKRHAKLEAVTWFARTGIDGQGAPSYVASGTILSAHVERDQEVVRLNNGVEVQIVATLWFDGATTSLPAQEDKLVLSDMTGIVVVRNEPADLQTNARDHVEIMIRQE